MTDSENQPQSISIPNLGGLITKDDIYYKGKVPYCSWAKTAQRIRENAPNWFFALESNPEGGFIWKAPDNTGYILGYFQNVMTGIRLPLYHYAITSGFNKTIPFDDISSNDLQKAHRRCLCACACYSFGDAFELWAGLEIEDAKKEEALPEKEDRIKRTPDKPKDEGEPIESIKDKDYGKPISDTARKTVIDKMTALFKKHPDKKDALIDKFKKQYGITTKQLSHADIRTAEQGQFLTIAINEIDSTL
ncbi:uncharacterized protein METZ01_LOCUS191435 [marine metagenome]|uniref:Uncharacterized protein n=1 Tax=marine metagenome TaxID=408172 RepID=A0A382DLI5_9ZZZZ